MAKVKIGKHGGDGKSGKMSFGALHATVKDDKINWTLKRFARALAHQYKIKHGYIDIIYVGFNFYERTDIKQK